jgi:hypothetical protein
MWQIAHLKWNSFHKMASLLNTGNGSLQHPDIPVNRFEDLADERERE